MTEEPPTNEGRVGVIATLIAAAILLPLGIWLKSADPLHIADWIRQFFH